jgi:hypothetical protein
MGAHYINRGVSKELVHSGSIPPKVPKKYCPMGNFWEFQGCYLPLSYTLSSTLGKEKR